MSKWHFLTITVINKAKNRIVWIYRARHASSLSPICDSSPFFDGSSTILDRAVLSKSSCQERRDKVQWESRKILDL